jgi:hypothetical protein
MPPHPPIYPDFIHPPPPPTTSTTMREGLDLPEFGYLPFDHFVVISAPRSSIHICESKSILSSLFAQANWDTISPLSKREQKNPLLRNGSL